MVTKRNLDLEDLMAFDRDTCEVFRQFRRNIHPADVPVEIARLGNVVTSDRESERECVSGEYRDLHTGTNGTTGTNNE